MKWIFKILFFMALGGTDVPVTRQGVILHTYPHDSLAFTQGLFYRDGFMYESTGLRKWSSLRKVDIETGRVLFQYNLPVSFFGEGMTIFRDKIYQLTWKNRLCLVYDLQSMCFIRAFRQPVDGWGLTHYDSLLIMSNGSDKLYFIVPDSFEVMDSLRVFDDKGAVRMLNELEVIEGEVYANILGKHVIAKISLQSGQVLEYIDFTALRSRHRNPMNGISYDPRAKKMYVTGKLWSALYEVER